MKLRTTKHIVKEGFLNVSRNKLMSFASISTIIATLIIFGIFLIVSINMALSAKSFEDRPEMEAFCHTELDDTQINKVEQEIKANTKIKTYSKITKKQALERFRQMLGENASILDGLEEDFLEVSFILDLKDATQSDQVETELNQIEGVRKVAHPKKEIGLISKFAYWINLGSILVSIILLIVSVFIISNTIKLTVFARRKEINIMKYIGATDWFIRWPFIVEGAILGLAAALIAFAPTAFAYDALESKINSDFSLFTHLIHVAPISEIGGYIIGTYVLIGMLVGSMGSLISIRRYLHV